LGGPRPKGRVTLQSRLCAAGAARIVRLGPSGLDPFFSPIPRVKGKLGHALHFSYRE
jgi:hypothetical protein